MKRSRGTRLPVPDELQHLIEKRDGSERRARKNKRSASQPLERRSGKERRKNA